MREVKERFTKMPNYFLRAATAGLLEGNAKISALAVAA